VWSVIWYFGFWFESLRIPGRLVLEYVGPEAALERLFLPTGAGEGWIYWFWCHGAREEGRMASQTIACDGGSVGFVAGYVAVM
jgi:hypothetical protein